MSVILSHALQRLEAFRASVREVMKSEFPYPHGREALGCIEERANTWLETLRGFTPANDPAVVRNACDQSLGDLREDVIHLGFILRSTHVRNGFECYAPLLRLARAMLGEQTRLVVSSEWHYQPFTYTGIPRFPGFVLIGLPAPESANPLLLPLAGHELGHHLWVGKGFEKLLGEDIEERCVQHLEANWAGHQAQYPQISDPGSLASDIDARATWAMAYEWAVRQAQETFCDLVGLWLFSESFLHATAYLTAPTMHFEGARSPQYPSTKTRIAHLLTGASKWGTDAPQGYASWFEDEPAPQSAEVAYQLAIADQVSGAVVPGLIDRVDELLQGLNLPRREGTKAAAVKQAFKLLTPAAGHLALTNIVNGAWMASLDDTLWVGQSRIKDRGAVLKDLVLKSLEVNEIETLVGAPPHVAQV